jgi:DNA-binding response OmpR family regulator
MSNVSPNSADAIASATCWIVAHGVAVEEWSDHGSSSESTDRLRRRPILFLVQPGAEPPDFADDLADWVQLPGDAEELLARARTLVGRARVAGMVLTYVDADDVLRVGDRLAVLSPIEARIMRILLDHVGTVVSREDINLQIWPAKAPNDFSVLNNRVKLLRGHIANLPMRIHTVRRRGLLLEIGASSRRLAPDVAGAQAGDIAV